MVTCVDHEFLFQNAGKKSHIIDFYLKPYRSERKIIFERLSSNTHAYTPNIAT